MSRRGRLEARSCPMIPGDQWFPSMYKDDIEAFVCDWLKGLTRGLAYRYVENGVTVYMPLHGRNR